MSQRSMSRKDDVDSTGSRSEVRELLRELALEGLERVLGDRLPVERPASNVQAWVEY